MKNSQHLVKCPKCNCSVRSDRLQKHINKVHNTEDIPLEGKKSVKVKNSSSLMKTTFKQVEYLVSSWLRRRKDYLYNSQNITVLTVMVLEKIGYSLAEIKEFYNQTMINNEQYNLSTKRLKITYELMMDELYKTFDRYSKGKIKNRKRNPYYFEDKDDDFDEYADWYDCNTVDRMDGSKYIGYLAREYEGSRYGSYPVHDDYSEEAWADDNPWE